MKHDFRGFFKKYLGLCIALALLLSLGGVALADYVRSSRTFRVVAAYGEQRSAFSSNYLRPVVTISENLRSFQLSNEGASDNLTVCNHPQNSETVSEVDIKYKMKARLKVYAPNQTTGEWEYRDAAASDFDFTDGDLTLRLCFGNSMIHSFLTDSGDSGTVSGSFESGWYLLTAYLLTDHTFKVTSSGALAACSYPLAIDLEAMPEQIPGAPETLRARLQLSVLQSAHETSWAGAFEWDTDTAIGGYDGYNYAIVSNGAGAGRYTLTWDHTKLTLNRAFVDFTLAKQYPSDYATHVDVSGLASGCLTFDVDPEQTARYELQFYPLVNDLTKQGVNALVSFSPAA